MEITFHFPTTLEQFQQQFPTEDSCIDYLTYLKWPNGFSCPLCGHSHAYLTTTRRLPLYECLQCHHQTSPIAGTIMSGSRTSLMKWFTAIFLISQPEQGINAVALSRIINVTYKTAWLILHKIRHTCSLFDQKSPLSGVVQVNSATYGQPFNPYYQNHPQEHYLFAGASLNHLEEPSYFKLKLVPRIHVIDRLFQRSATTDFSQHHIDPNVTSTAFIVGRFNRKRFTSVLDLAASAGKFINDTFHGIGPKYLQSYLDEFCYKANLSLKGLSVFQHLIQLCTSSRLAPINSNNARSLDNPLCA